MIFGFIVLLSSLAEAKELNNEAGLTKYLFLNNKPCMVRPTTINLNPVDLKHYPFIISLNKCTGSCNVLSPKICVPKETIYIKLKLKQLS